MHPAGIAAALSPWKPSLLALAMYGLLVLALMALLLFFCSWLGEGKSSREKLRPYESGIIPTGTAQLRSPVPFYLVAIFFLIFDVEAVFILSWAVAFDQLGWAGWAPILIILLAIPIVGRVHSSTVTQPMNGLVAALERMRQGDFTERLAAARRDEFGILSTGLNRVADDLSELVGQVQRSGIQVNTTATEIAATAREQQTTAHEIAATTAEIGATSKQISATSKELVKTMNEVSHVAEHTAALNATAKMMSAPLAMSW